MGVSEPFNRCQKLEEWLPFPLTFFLVSQAISNECTLRSADDAVVGLGGTCAPDSLYCC